MGTFQADLIQGQKIEQCVGKFLTDTLLDFSIIKFNNDHRYDFIANHSGKQFTYEIKHKRLKNPLDFVLIEFESWNKPAGISTSVSNFHIFAIEIDKLITLILIPTYKLKELSTSFSVLELNNPNNIAKLYKVPLPNLKHHGSVLTTSLNCSE